jgi:hypothetical protein
MIVGDRDKRTRDFAAGDRMPVRSIRENAFTLRIVTRHGFELSGTRDTRTVERGNC